MKKLITLLFLVIAVSFSFAQKKELKTAEKAIKNNNFDQAKVLLNQLQSSINSADQKLKDKYHFLLGQTLYANGSGKAEDFDAAIDNLEKSGKTYASNVAEIKSNMISTLLQNANDALKQKDFVNASIGYEQAYKLDKESPLYLYYAASTAVSNKDYDRSLKFYKKLYDLEYTGITTEYAAINKETQIEDNFGSNKFLRDASVKSGTHIKPTEITTESRAPEIAKNIALIYISKGDNEKAIEAINAARLKNPDDVNLLISEANVYYKMGDTVKFKSLMEEATTKDPNNAELQYNLGVISYNAEEIEAAQKYYNKAIELDPTNVNSFINLGALITGKEQAIIDEMNKLGSSAADDKKYEEYQVQRIELYKEALGYYKKALEVEPNNILALKNSMSIYGVLDDTENFDAIKQKIEELEGQN